MHPAVATDEHVSVRALARQIGEHRRGVGDSHLHRLLVRVFGLITRLATEARRVVHVGAVDDALFAVVAVGFHQRRDGDLGKEPAVRVGRCVRGTVCRAVDQQQVQRCAPPESAAEAEVVDDVVVVEDGVGVEVGVCAFAALVPAIAISITAVAAVADDRLSVSE